MLELTIVDTVIRRDGAGRYCVNDLHRASGGNPKDKPGNWLANGQTKALIAELDGPAGIPAGPLATVNDGINNGTYVAELLVIAYAAWISPAFHVRVLTAYRNLVAQATLPAIPDFRNPAAAARAWAEQFEAAEALRIQTEQQAAQLALAAPRVEFAEALMNSEGTAKVGDVAKTLGLPVMKLHRALRMKGVILADNTPAAQYVDKGYFKPATHRQQVGGGERLRIYTRVTVRGIQWIRRFAQRHHDLLTPNKGAARQGAQQ